MYLKMFRRRSLADVLVRNMLLPNTAPGVNFLALLWR
jgi:hypothetical protein